MRTERARETGFSLLELLVAVGLLTVIMGVVFQFAAESQKTFGINQATAEAHQNADLAMLRVAAILRGAGANPANIPSINVLSFLKYTTPGDKTSVDILADLNGNGTTDDNVEGSIAHSSDYYLLTSEDVTLRYNEDAQTIELVDNTTDGSESVKLAEHIDDFEIEILENRRAARVTITAWPSRRVGSDEALTYTVVSEIRLRNRY